MRVSNIHTVCLTRTICGGGAAYHVLMYRRRSSTGAAAVWQVLASNRAYIVHYSERDMSGSTRGSSTNSTEVSRRTADYEADGPSYAAELVRSLTYNIVVRADSDG